MWHVLTTVMMILEGLASAVMAPRNGDEPLFSWQTIGVVAALFPAACCLAHKWLTRDQSAL